MKKSQMGSSKYEFDGDLDADVKKRQEVIDQLHSEITEYLFDKSLEYQVMMNGNGSYNVFLHEVIRRLIIELNELWEGDINEV